MSLFGQVWLWSVLAFAAGVLLTWLLLVRPAQARNRLLERRLLAAQAAPAPEPEPEQRVAPTRTFEPEPEPEPEPEQRVAPTRAYEPEPFQPEHPADHPAQPEPGPQPHWYERDSFGSPVTEQAESGGALFSSPVSSALEPESEHRPEPESEAEKTSVFAPFEQAESGSLFESGKETGSLFEPSRETGSLFDT
ncbi:hypothetical protein FNH05_09945, partial [Amycolatopsis rhizosphaerae]